MLILYSMRIPAEVKNISSMLKKQGHEAYLVGGCVRDFLLKKKPKDWDITTNATPQEIQNLFPDSVYENQFGTVAVKTKSEDLTIKVVEVTTFRKEGKYTDKRHPDDITFAKTVEEDLSRRDFTVNAIAYDVKDEAITDPYGGQADLVKKVIRAVGEPAQRFEEDALRLLRVVRLAAQLGFTIEERTAEAAKEKAGLVEFVAEERIADEFAKLLMTDRAVAGIRMLENLDLLRHVVPELREGIDCEQNKHHIYTVFEHNLRSLEYTAEKGFPLHLRLAALLHDVGKPRVREWKNDPRGEKLYRGKKGDWTFYQHQYVGEKMVLQIMDRLHFPKEMTERVALLVREHMFVYDPDVVTEKGVRRLVRRVGEENVDDLIKLREADRIGSGVPKAQPYRLRHLQAMIEKAKKEPLNAKMLKVGGEEVMKELDIAPGPEIGQILSILLEEVVDDPSRNTKTYLSKRMRELHEMPEKERLALMKKAKEATAEAQERIDREIKRKYFVK